MSEFYVIFVRKTIKMLEFLLYLPENARILHANFRKKYFPIFWGGGVLISDTYVSGPPISVLVIIIGLMVCAPLEIIVPRLCPGSEIFLAPPLLDSAIDLNESVINRIWLNKLYLPSNVFRRQSVKT